jgi:muconolactone delta-isomerase
MGDLFKPKTKEEANMPKKVFLTLVLIACLLSLVWLASSQSTASKNLTKANPSQTSSVPSKEAISAKLATLDRGWVKNEGQWDEEVLFSAPGYFGTTWITKDGELLHVAVKKEECKDKTEKAQACPSKSWVISERWVGGKVQTITPEKELPTRISFFVGNDPSKHKTNLPTYRYVSLGEVWSGIEVKLKATQKTVEKLFYVKPGADPSEIVVEVDGAKGLRLSKDGEIIIQTGLGELKLSKPIAWQEKDGKKLSVEVSYKLLGKNRYSFEVAKADPSLPIVIDPILQSTYLGGGGYDEAHAIAIHPKTGEIYVVGWTSSTSFPKTTGGAQASKSRDYDAFVARLNSNLTRILQSTYLGGNDSDYAYALAIHPTTGEIYVAGDTESTDFPKTTGGAQAEYGGSINIFPFRYPYISDLIGDAFVAKLSADLTQLLQSTYLGGRNRDTIRAIAIHPTTGEVYVAGYTFSLNFPGTNGGAQAKNSGYYDAFVARLNPDLTRILQSTYLGESESDYAYALAIHPTTGEIYVAGSTEYSELLGFGTGYNVFVARLNKELTQIFITFYFGGSSDDYVRALAIHPKTGEVYVAGYTYSTDFPKTTGGAQANNSGGSDVFVARLNKELIQLIQSTYLGGRFDDEAYALAVHPKTGEIYVAGKTYSEDFPQTAGGAQAQAKHEKNIFSSLISIDNGFVARLNPDLTQILQATYLGGSWGAEVHALAVHPKTGEVYVAGETSSEDFPQTAGGAQAKYSGSDDAFVARLSADLAAGRGFGSGCGCPMTSSTSSKASLWNIFVWLSFPAFVLARRIRRK